MIIYGLFCDQGLVTDHLLICLQTPERTESKCLKTLTRMLMNHGQIQTEHESCSLASLLVVSVLVLWTSANYKAMTCPWLLCLLFPGKLYKNECSILLVSGLHVQLWGKVLVTEAVFVRGRNPKFNAQPHVFQSLTADKVLYLSLQSGKPCLPHLVDPLVLYQFSIKCKIRSI